MKDSGRERGISTGTVVMLVAAVLVILMTVTVLSRLAGTFHAVEAGTAVQTAAAKALPSVTPGQAASAAAKATAAPERTFTVTAGGTVAVEKGVRQSCYFSETKKYDFAEVMALTRDDWNSDLTLVSLENLVDPSRKVSGLVSPADMMGMISAAGIDYASIGFRRSFEYGAEAVRTTEQAAEAAGVRVYGAYSTAEKADASVRYLNVGGVRVALLHFTDTITSSSQKALKKDGRTALLPRVSDAPQIIANARAKGAEIVVVTLHWGTDGKTAPTKAQRETAQLLADAGADVIIGSGTRRVQPVEWLTASRRTGQTRVLCAWSLGCLVSDSRNAGAVAGMLLNFTVHCTADGQISLSDVTYTPTYLWSYKQDGSTRYRLLASDREAPDGMSSDDTKNMGKALKRVQDQMAGGAAVQRTVPD